MTAKGPGSVTSYLAGLKGGDQDSASKLWERYFPRLVLLARRIFQERRRHAAAEGSEDAAAHAFQSVLADLARDDSVTLSDRDEFWVMLAMQTRNRAIDILRRELARKRGGGRVLSESDVDVGFEEVVGWMRTPDEMVIGMDQQESLLDRLGDETLREVALLRRDGYTNVEIAQRLGRSLADVGRKLALIRRIWGGEQP